MKVNNLILLILSTITVYSCGDNNISTTEKEYQDHLREQRCFFTKSKFSKDSIFPFSQADKIEIISYDSTSARSFFGGRINRNGSLHDSLSQNGIRERVVLYTGQIDTIYSILYDYKFSNDNTLEESAACYNPRHAILFYKANKLIEYLEICFECQRIEFVDRRSNFGIMCDDKWCYLIEYFKKCGIKSNFSEKNNCRKNKYSKI
jgi:hypothetical protein